MATGTGFGTKLERETATPGTYAAIAQILSVTPPQYSRDTHETTTADVTDGYKTFIGGLKDAGEVSMEIEYDPDTHNTLIDDLDEAGTYNYRVVLPWGTIDTCTFAAVMTAFNPQAPAEDKLTATVNFKVSGKPVWS